MPVGYLVSLGANNALDSGDAIGGGAVSFTAEKDIGAGQWSWSGTHNDTTYTNQVEPGRYYLAANGAVYFVPDYGPVSSLSSSSVIAAPSFTRIFGTAGADTLAGSAGADAIYGGATTGETGTGDDSINAGGGDDVVHAGDGNDTITGGAGADAIHGGAGTDTASYADSTSGVNVSLASGTGSGGSAQGDVLTSVENLTGSAYADTLSGSAGDNRIEGGDGNDTITGLAGNDTLDGGAGNDVVDGDAGNDLIAGGAGDDTLTGGLGADTITGGDGNDAITGAGGHVGVGGTSAAGTTFHAIRLGTFADVDTDETNGISENASALLGSYGDANAPLLNNIVTVTANDANADGIISDDDRDGTPETITVDGVTYKLDSNQSYFATVTFTDGTTGTFTAVVAQTTTGETFLLPEMSNNADNALLTGQPIQSITLTATETVDTSMGSRRIDADFQVPATDESADTIDAGAGSDTVDGGGGADTIAGGAGDDLIRLGAGDGAADTVVLGTGGGSDVIHDFVAPTVNGDGSFTGHDLLDVSGLTDPQGNAVKVWDVTVTDSNGDGTGDAVLSFPGGESVTLVGVSVNEVDSGPELRAMGIPCFVRGTRIATASGERAIEDLRAGDRVITRDHGAQTLRWVGSRRVAALGDAAPVEIAAGRFGNPRPLRVSPQHRMLLAGWQVELLFGELEVLAAARHLVDGSTVVIRPGGKVDYFHLLFDTHEIVFADGAAAESLYPGPEGLAALEPRQRAEIFRIMPALAAGDGAAYGPTARRCLKAHEASLLAAAPAMGARRRDAGRSWQRAG